MKRILLLLLLIFPLSVKAQILTPSPAAMGAPFEVTHNDVLIVNSTFAAGLPAGYSAVVQYYVDFRIKRASDGIIRDYTNGPVTFTAGPGTPLAYPLPDGVLESITVGQQNSTPRGPLYTQIFVGRPNVGIYNYTSLCMSATTMAGFQTMSWPGPGCAQSSDGPPAYISFTLTNPSTATNWTKTFTNAIRNEVVNIRFQLVTSATAGTRQVCINFTDGTTSTIFASKCAFGTQAASTTVTYNFSQGVGTDLPFTLSLPSLPTGTDVMLPLPVGLSFDDSATIASVVSGLTTGDQLQNIVIRVRLWNGTD